MKNLVVAAFFCLIQINCDAQKATVTAVKMNVVYVGIPNELMAVAERYPCQSLLLTTDNGRIEKHVDCRYDYYPDHWGVAMVSVNRRSGKDTILIQKTQFRAKSIPSPVAKLGGKSEGSIAASFLSAQMGIAAIMENFDFDAMFRVKRFQLTLIKNAGISTTFNTSNGPLFTNEMKAALHTAMAGDRLTVFDIVADGPAEKNIPLLPIELTIE